MKRVIYTLIMMLISMASAYAGELEKKENSFYKWEGFWEGSIYNDNSEYPINLEFSPEKGKPQITELFSNWKTIKSKWSVDDKKAFGKIIAEFSKEENKILKKKKALIIFECQYEGAGRADGIIKIYYCKEDCGKFEELLEKTKPDETYDVAIDKVP